MYLLIIMIFISLCTPSFAEFPAVKVYQKTSKAVVLIVGFGHGSNSMIGSGSIITKTGNVITNAHVVIDKSTSKPYSKVKVYIKPNKVTGKFNQDLVNDYIAKVISYDIDLDLAILKVKALPPDTGTIELANSEEIQIGEEVVAIGHPEQGGLWTLTYGRISGEIASQSGIQGKDVFQTDTSVNRGNSGGPLLDKRGYMVGVNTNIARLGAGNLPITGVNFAVKSSVVKKWLERQNFMIAYGKKPLHEEIQGVSVKSGGVEPKVEDEKPAETHITKSSEDKILTPMRPYKIDALFEEVEKEMEDLMEEMRGKIRK